KGKHGLTNLLGAVVFISVGAELAAFFQATPDLSTNTSAISLLQGSDLVTDSNDSANDFVAGAQREWHHSLSPAGSGSMQIGTADTAGNDFEVDIVGLELFGFELEVELSEGRILKGLQDSALRTSRRLKLL